MKGALKFRTAQVPRQNGELARLKVAQGPDQGALYVLTSPRATIGRGEENDVVLLDLKASRQHAELISTAQGSWSVRDAGSANGILHNGKSAREAVLNLGDTIHLGETVLEFLVSNQSATSLLTAPSREVSKILLGHAQLETARKHVQSLGKNSGASGSRSRLFKLGGLAAVALVFYFVLSPGGPKKSRSRPENPPIRDLASFLPPSVATPEATRSAEMFFKGGFREFREKNYLRAKTQFETVLQVAPGHRLATLYLQNCNKMIEDEVKFHLERGKKGLQSGKLKEAKGHYEAVMRLLYREPESTPFREAKDQLQKTVELMQAPEGTG